MKLRPFGRTGIVVTPLGLGLAALGRPGYINLGHAQDLGHGYNVTQMEAAAHQVLDAAWNAGIRYFDAARSYGRGEEFLASWLRKSSLQPGAVAVGSKWGYTYTAGWQVRADKHEVKEHSLPVLQRQIRESREQLGDHLRLYQIHSATLESGVLADRAVLDELARLRGKGLVIGLSLSGPQQAATLERALEIRYDGLLLFGAVQATWNLLERSAATMLEAAHAAGLGVTIKEALANGRLTSRNDAAEFQSQRRQLESAAAERGTSIDALALAAALAQPWAHVVLSGAATVEQLHSNLQAVKLEGSAALTERLADLTENPAEYWARRNALPWN
jgi:aryl-alcohol dehydrogenase-like predicted oxidoreductase